MAVKFLWLKNIRGGGGGGGSSVQVGQFVPGPDGPGLEGARVVFFVPGPGMGLHGPGEGGGIGSRVMQTYASPRKEKLYLGSGPVGLL